MELTDPRNVDWSRPTLDHVHLRVSDLAASKAFYARVLEPLGIPFVLDTEHLVQFGSLALSDDAPPTSGAHIAFTASSPETVDAFHAAALAAGASDHGVPGPRVHGAYAAYVLDPDGTNIEAAHRRWPS